MPYTLFGADTSPYSRKVRAALRYKNIEFNWVARNRENEAAFLSLATTPTLPLLQAPDGVISQDSSQILSLLETRHPEPPAEPDDPVLACLSLILEDYADEWLNKAMFQQRWGQQPDRDAASLRTLVQMNDGKRPRSYKAITTQIGERMTSRLPLVGAQPANADVLQASFRRCALLVDRHLKDHLFLFGGQPSSADFAMAAQFQQMLADPTPAAWLTERAPFLVAWCEHMDDPKASGPYLSQEALEPTLLPLFSQEVAKTYLPWATANRTAAAQRRDKVSLVIADGPFEQVMQHHAARRFRALETRLRRPDCLEGVSAFLRQAGAALPAEAGKA